MANSWGGSGTSWGIGNWGQQNNTTITLTGIGLTSSAGEAIAYNHSGWGRLTWGDLDWGEQVGNCDRGGYGHRAYCFSGRGFSLQSYRMGDV